jgi:hypothetical protein
MSESSNPNSESIDSMHPHSGTFILSKTNPEYPAFNENIYLLMRGFNAIKINGTVNNAQVMIKWNISRQYGTDLWVFDNKVDDTLAFPFKNNNGTITFEGKAENENATWEAKLNFEFVNLTNDEIEELENSDSS